MGMFMGFSPVERVVRYVGMEDRYTLKHSYVRLPGQAPSVPSGRQWQGSQSSQGASLIDFVDLGH